MGTSPHLKVKLSAESLVRMTTDKNIKDVGHIKTSLKGKQIYRDNCNEVSQKETKAHVSLLIFVLCTESHSPAVYGIQSKVGGKDQAVDNKVNWQ